MSNAIEHIKNNLDSTMREALDNNPDGNDLDFITAMLLDEEEKKKKK